MIYSINMHTTVYQFWRFVYHHEQSAIDHYARSSLYTLSICTKIRLHVYHLSWPLFNRRPILLIWHLGNFPLLAPFHPPVYSQSTHVNIVLGKFSNFSDNKSNIYSFGNTSPIQAMTQGNNFTEVLIYRYDFLLKRVHLRSYNFSDRSMKVL